LYIEEDVRLIFVEEANRMAAYIVDRSIAVGESVDGLRGDIFIIC